MSETPTRIYIIDSREYGEPPSERPIRATSEQAALAFVAKAKLGMRARVATQADLERLLGKGVKVENARTKQEKPPS